MRYLQTKKNDNAGDFGGELSLGAFSTAGVWLYGIAFKRKVGGEWI